MCGINGFNWDDKGLILEMNRTISHRGPDQHSYYLDKGISLGHQRLSIIDLTQAGKQPMHNEDNSIWIVFNGEIYNYKPIKESLEKKGHKFYSNTDTEVIIHAYEEYGPDCVQLFNGMFAFAIYDTKKRILFLARDRLGINPLYYYLKDRKIIFSSEIKAILQHKEIPRKINPRALHDYLSFRAVTLSETMFENIKKLEPGTYMVYYNYDSFDKNKAFKAYIKRYWDLSFKPNKESEDFHAKNVLNLMRESIKKRLMSDVPLGVYLSGGIDSGTVISLMKELVDEPINTFTVGFGIDEHKDEISKARFLADYYRTNHHEISVKADAPALLPSLVWHMDEPMCDPTSIPTYYLSKATKKNCTVVLTGEGGDEAFGGYVQYKIMNLHQKYLRYKSQLFRDTIFNLAKITPVKVLNKFFKYTEGLGKEGFNRFSRFIKTNDYGEQYLSLVSIFDEYEKRDLFNDQNAYLIEQQKLVSRMNSFLNQKGALLNKLLLLETKTLLTENLLMKVDKNTMAFGVEARVPFLDHNVIEYAASIPAELKLKGKTEKFILRKAMKGIVPEYTLQQKKERFFVPIHHWFSGELFDIAKQMFSEKNVKKSGYFNPNYINKIFSGFNDSKIFYSRQLWSLLVFELWKKIYIDSDRVELPNKRLGDLNYG